jgi:uncharacterized protein YjbJ (UPF0337 family)
MDWNRIEGNWKQFKGRAKEKWGRLTDDDLDVINGRQEQLEGKIQQRYGLAKDQAKKDVKDWFIAVSGANAGRKSVQIVLQPARRARASCPFQQIKRRAPKRLGRGRSFLLVQLPLDKRFGDVTRACLDAAGASV